MTEPPAPAPQSPVPQPLAGATIVVTGGNAGLGFFTCRHLAAAGARVIMAARNRAKAAAAIDAIQRQYPKAQLQFQPLDLADLASVKLAAEQLAGAGRLDAIVANAGVVGSVRRRLTADGFELMLGTNHLGHFALLGRLLPVLAEQSNARIVHVGSISHRWVRLNFDDLMQLSYSNPVAYARSKLAVMTFGFELDRRLRAVGSRIESVVAHPGLALNALSPAGPGRAAAPSALQGLGALLAQGAPLAQGKDAGAEPLVQAAVSRQVRSGQYWGPDGWFQLTGRPAAVPAKPQARDRYSAARLWEESEELTGVPFRI